MTAQLEQQQETKKDFTKLREWVAKDKWRLRSDAYIHSYSFETASRLVLKLIEGQTLQLCAVYEFSKNISVVKK